MENAKNFGARIRELRIRAHLTLRELAERVGVDFTYLSKIENGVLPPPSEKVILELAEVLKADKDELMTLAGKIPSDIARMLKNREVLKLLRSPRIQKKVGALGKRGQGVYPMSTFLKNFPVLPGITKLSRMVLAFALVTAVSVSLWFAVPIQALSIQVSNPASGIVNVAYPFSATVTIADQELLPIERVDLYIYKSDNRVGYQATLANLPLNSGSATYTASATGGGQATVNISSPTLGWGYGYGYSSWQGYGYRFFSPGGYGYGYGYGYGSGATSITYNIDWVPPSAWPAANYTIEIKLTANGQTFTQLGSEFALSRSGIAGSVTMEGRSQGPGWVTSATVQLWSVGANRTTASPIATHIVTTRNDGSFDIAVAPGSYDVTIKGSHTLRKLAGNVSISADAVTSVNFGTLVEGDCWGSANAPDNVVDISDYSATLYSFGTVSGDVRWVATADLNQDGVVDIADYSIVLFNFGQMGVTP